MTLPASTILVFLDPAFENGRIADSSQPQLMATDLGATRVTASSSRSSPSGAGHGKFKRT
ncbi:hypothetical protein GCM10023063_00110 [Arthrobacter methylotrophus]